MPYEQTCACRNKTNLQLGTNCEKDKTDYSIPIQTNILMMQDDYTTSAVYLLTGRGQWVGLKLHDKKIKLEKGMAIERNEWELISLRVWAK